MPFGTYQGSVSEAVANAARFLKEAGADGVKLEGGRRVAEAVRQMTEAGIPVMGHIGMTPQSVHQYGGFKVQGREQEQRRALLDDAKALEEAGVFSDRPGVHPGRSGRGDHRCRQVPTIGIGAGPDCDGQVLVIHDLLGLVDDFKPKFVKRYAELGQEARRAVGQYCEEVRDGKFPTGRAQLPMSARRVSGMRRVTTIQEIREAVAEAKSGRRPVGFVPTMGAARIEGHGALIDAAVAECE